MTKSILTNRKAKITVDILLVAGLFLTISSGQPEGAAWGSFHCIASMAWYALLLVHTGQHWHLCKALIMKPKVMKRNLITFLTLILFFLLTFSIVLFVAGINDRFVRIHHVVASLISKVMIIHLFMKAKQFVRLFKNPQIPGLRKKQVDDCHSEKIA